MSRAEAKSALPRYLLIFGAAAAAMLGRAQPQPKDQSFYAEQREENWLPDGKRDEDFIRITRLSNRSVLAIHPQHSQSNRTQHTGAEFFYLSDTRRGVQFNGDTVLRAAWPQYVNSLPGSPNPMVDQYGNCSVLLDASTNKTAAGKIRGFDVWKIETSYPREIHTQWVAPELGCFPLRSQVLVDGLVRERTETVRVKLLTAGTQLALPRGVRIVSPRTYCDLYRKRYGREYLPQRLCAEYQLLYERAASVVSKPENSTGKP